MAGGGVGVHKRVRIKITISFSGRTSLQQLENTSNLERMKQFHGYGFPGDPAVFLSLLTNCACHWRDGAPLKRNKQAKSGQRVWLLQVGTNFTSIKSSHGKQLALGLLANLVKISPLSLNLKTFHG